ncbi:hypothetical protein KIW84_076129 [Lathyrus oleraceus]|uniref:Uncharacterized protein n=1 Tax=Pisum sativum TaxID=3888 RepID=A0A9D5A0S4_PEA|nr:hypothetical protein KIW84_076129 [Pisum sativum]
MDRDLKAAWFASDQHKEKMLHTEGLLGQALEEKTSLKAKLKTTPRVFVPQYYGANPYGAQLSMPMGNPDYTVSPAAMVTYPLQEDPTDLYHGPSIHSDAAKDAVQVNMITEDENLIMDVLKVKTLLVLVHLKLFKAGILKQNHEKCSICLRDSKGYFDVQKGIQMLISNSVLQPTIIVNGVEKPLVNNKVVTNIADASGLTRSGGGFTPANLRGGKRVVEKPDNEGDAVVTQFQGLEIANAVRIEDLDEEDKVGTSMLSLKDAQHMVASGQALRWGKIV